MNSARVGESPTDKSKRMAVEVPKRIAETAAAAQPIYDVVKPAAEHQKARASRKAKS